MKALLLVAHGSKRVQSNAEIEDLSALLHQHPSEFDTIAHAFLEIADPNILQGLENLRALGVKDITVMPYFLSAGNHVIRDVPSVVNKFIAKHPHLTVSISPHFGLAQGIAELILAQAHKL